jgi:hypothetical protein
LPCVLHLICAFKHGRRNSGIEGGKKRGEGGGTRRRRRRELCRTKVMDRRSLEQQNQIDQPIEPDD